MSDQEQDPFRELDDDVPAQEKDLPQDHTPKQNHQEHLNGDQRQAQDCLNEGRRRDIDELEKPAEAECAAEVPVHDEWTELDDRQDPEEEAPGADEEQIQDDVAPSPESEYPVEPQQQSAEDPQEEDPQKQEVYPEYPQEEDPKPEEVQPKDPQKQEVYPEYPQEEVPKPEEVQPKDPQEEDPQKQEVYPEYPQEEDPKPEEVQPKDPQEEDPQKQEVYPEYPQEEDPKPEEVQPKDPQEEDPQKQEVYPEYPQEDDPKPEEVQPKDPQEEDPQKQEVYPEYPQEDDPKPEEVQPKDPQKQEVYPEYPQEEVPKPEEVQPKDPQEEDPQKQEVYPEYPQEEDPQPDEVQLKDPRERDRQLEEVRSEYTQELDQDLENREHESEERVLIRNVAPQTGNEDDAPPHSQKVHHAFKPRNMPRKQPIRWEPIEYDPREDSGDEFEMGTAMRPIYLEEGQEVPMGQPVFKNGEPDYHGEYLSCFDEPNLLYRILNREEKTWAFYNDSRSYEMHVQFIFGKHSKVGPLENTTMYTKASGEHVARVIVYPGETEMLIKGHVNGFTSKLRAIPLSEDYYICRQNLSEDIIQEEVKQVRRIAGEETNAEEVLRLCVEHNIPFVDLEFLPCQATLEMGAKKPFKKLAWYRPSMYLPEQMIDQIRLFRGRIRPAGVDPGELGDSWVMCSIAAISEHPQKLINMFRHPTDPEIGKKERAVGGYRVAFNKDGLWRSVIVDNYLPTSGGTPKYAKSSHDLAELWPSILEKAFAKLYGSYANICSGDPLHALQDMTGYPSWRFDEAFVEDSRSGKDGLFQQWIKFIKAGYQMILSTPGKEAHDTNSSSDSALSNRYKSAGLITGHAYTVLDVKYFPENEFRLIKIRNAWGRGTEWNGDWCDDDEKWEKFPEVAKSCNFQKAEDGTFWMTWEACQHYFNGGGVSFVHLSLNDYRVPSQFIKCAPSTILEVIVEEPTWMCITISQADKRCRADASEYQPVMLSITQPVGGEAYKVIQNSSADAYHPLFDKWAFYQARDISLIYKFQPEHSPYLIIPRIMAIEGQGDIVPYILGISCNKVIGQGGVTVNFKSIDKDNKVLLNFPKFAPETATVEAEYQVKLVDKSFAETRSGSIMY